MTLGVKPTGFLIRVLALLAILQLPIMTTSAALAQNSVQPAPLNPATTISAMCAQDIAFLSDLGTRIDREGMSAADQVEVTLKNASCTRSELVSFFVNQGFHHWKTVGLQDIEVVRMYRPVNDILDWLLGNYY